jgi:hypothetical protein
MQKGEMVTFSFFCLSSVNYFVVKNILSNKVFFYFVFTTGHGLMITHHRSVSCTTSLLKISSFLTMHQDPV